MKIKIKPIYAPMGIVLETQEEAEKFCKMIHYFVQNWMNLDDKIDKDILDFAMNLENEFETYYGRLVKEII